MQWKARSHAAYHGYSHLSGIEMTSALTMWYQRWLRPSADAGVERVGAVLPEPAVDVVVVVLLRPEHARERLAHDPRVVRVERRPG